MLLQTAFTESLMTALGITGFFLVFGIFAAVAIFFFFFFVGETKQLTDKEKKELYAPRNKFGRKLRTGEQSYTELDESAEIEEADNLSDSYMLGIGRSTQSGSYSDIKQY